MLVIKILRSSIILFLSQNPNLSEPDFLPVIDIDIVKTVFGFSRYSDQSAFSLEFLFEKSLTFIELQTLEITPLLTSGFIPSILIP